MLERYSKYTELDIDSPGDRILRIDLGARSNLPHKEPAEPMLRVFRATSPK